nr:reverse transcriptase domain-containing protein [Tanacetum cinerariifolium]
MANTTPIVTTVTKPATNPRDADATPRVNIQDFCVEYYEDILPIIMDKVRCDKRKEVHARLDFGEGSRERRTREDSHHSSHRRQSAFDRLSETYSPSTTKSRPGRTNSRDHPRGRSRPRRLDTSNEDCPEDMERFRGVRESYDDSYSHSYHDRDHSRHMKRIRDNESPLSSVSKSDSSDERYRKSKTKRHKPMDEDDLTRPWMCEEEDPFTPQIRNFESSRRTRMPNNVKTYDGTRDPEDHKYVKDPVEIHNIKQKDEETIEDFMEHFKLETRRMKGVPECMRIFGFMHGVDNPELTKRLNEHVPKTMEEMMITTTEFIRGEAAAASKKKAHTLWRTQDQSKSGVEGPLVIEEEMAGHMIHRMYVDGGSSMEILYEHCFNRIRPEVKNQMVPTTTSLTGFSGETIWPLGQLRLLVTIGDADHSTKAWMNFMIVRSLSPYNGIIERPRIREIQAAPSTAHRMLKFPVDRGIVTIRSTILIPAECTTVITSSAVSKEVGRTELCLILKENLDIFAWQPSDMTGVLRSVAEHWPNIWERYSPVRQKKRGQAPERAKAIHAEVQKLVEAGIMREVYYHDWLSNPVMVKKHDGSWRMCVDFMDLNKACPQDWYPLPKIDWKVESLCGYPFKCFLDAYKGYHQIQLAESDEEKTTFPTGQRVYCYTKMPFGLKNVGATYQRLVDKAFDGQIGQNIEVYVDALVVKSHTEAEMLRDIDETFRTLRKINMKLNPKKCTFGAVEGVFLGYVVTPEEMKPCPDKTAAELQLPSKSTCQNYKLVAPKPKEELIVCLSATYGAISAVLMTERGAIQTPVYFISRALQGSELNYTPMEKLVLSLVFAAKRLRRTSVKGHVLANFLTEMPDENPPAAPVVVTQREPWTLFTDGSSCVDGSGAELILTSPEGTEFTYVLRFQFAASNNEAEYEALIAGLRIAARMGVQNVHVSVDSKLVANQVLATDRKKARKLRIKARQYELLKGVLYRRSFLTSWLRCVGPLQAEYVIREIHEGSCSMYAEPRSVVAKAIRLGYYWPTMHRDVRDTIRTCNDCQIHRPVTRNPQQTLTPITAPWSFYKRSSYARVMIELLADEELKDTIVMAMPKIVGEEFNMCTIRVEYWWKPSRCSSCKLVGHILNECPKKIVSDVMKNLSNPRQATRDVSIGQKGNFLFMDDDGKPLPKVVSTLNADSETKEVGPGLDSRCHADHALVFFKTLIKMKAEKAKLFDEQMAKRLHDEEVEQAAAREKQEKDDLERAKVLQQQYVDKREYKKVQTLFKPDKDVEEPQKKRVAKETLLHESFKRSKAVEISVFEVKVEALQVKYPLIDWEIHYEGSRSYWKIIRVGRITESYKSFEDMLE